MGTQAVVSIVQGKQTIVKAVAGCNGAQAPNLAEALRSQPAIITAPAVYDLARQLNFGCADCLVVLDAVSIMGADDGEAVADYRATFHRPEWNPRWDYGTAEYVEIVER